MALVKAHVCPVSARHIPRRPFPVLAVGLAGRLGVRWHHNLQTLRPHPTRHDLGGGTCDLSYGSTALVSTTFDVWAEHIQLHTCSPVFSKCLFQSVFNKVSRVEQKLCRIYKHTASICTQNLLPVGCVIKNIGRPFI